MVVFPSFAAFETFVQGLGVFHMDLRLERMQRILTQLDLHRPQGLVLQVVGTNAKGSTSSMLEGIARAHGIQTGVFSSPHFLSLRERVRVNGALLSEDDWLEAANRVAAHQPELTYFEWMTVVALVLFAQRQVDMGVLEAGLGGRHDATTAVAADLTVLTPIGRDHEAVLGPGVKRIAADKAGALRRKVPGISAPQTTTVRRVLQSAAAKQDSVVHFVPPAAGPQETSPWSGRLPGVHQEENARLARQVWQWCAFSLACPTRPELVEYGLQHAWLPGRLQWCALGRTHILLDAAHNPPAVGRLREYVSALETPPRQLIFSCLQDKATPAFLQRIRRLQMDTIWVPELPAGPRRLPAQHLAAALDAVAVEGMTAAVKRAECSGKPTLVCGSLYLLAEFFKLHPRFLNPEGPESPFFVPSAERSVL